MTSLRVELTEERRHEHWNRLRGVWRKASARPGPRGPA